MFSNNACNFRNFKNKTFRIHKMLPLREQNEISILWNQHLQHSSGLSTLIFKINIRKLHFKTYNDGNTFDKQSVKLLSKIEKTFVLYTLFGIKLCIFLAFCSIKRKIMFFAMQYCKLEKTVRAEIPLAFTTSIKNTLQIK